MFLYFIIMFLAIACFPEQSFAWGGGVHLQVGLKVLENLNILPAAIASILAAHPRDYLYGCIAADITLGKKYTHYLLNCHRWQVGQKVLKAAGTDSERACAYGYLSHLAADSIAHNYYVPYKIMRSFATITMKHTYWEMRFETVVEKEVWEQARAVCETNQQANDALLRRVLTPTIFSFGTNKRIFNSIMLLSRLEKWQKVMQTLSNKSRYELSQEDREEYLKLTEKAVLSFLQEGGMKLPAIDPTGERALVTADAFRKNLRLLYKSGRLTKLEGLEQVDAIKIKLFQALEKPKLLEELHNGKGRRA